MIPYLSYFISEQANLGKSWKSVEKIVVIFVHDFFDKKISIGTQILQNFAKKGLRRVPVYYV